MIRLATQYEGCVPMATKGFWYDIVVGQGNEQGEAESQEEARRIRKPTRSSVVRTYAGRKVDFMQDGCQHSHLPAERFLVCVLRIGVRFAFAQPTVRGEAWPTPKSPF